MKICNTDIAHWNPGQVLTVMLLIQLPANMPGKAKDSPSAQVPVTHMGDKDEAPVWFGPALTIWSSKPAGRRY